MGGVQEDKQEVFLLYQDQSDMKNERTISTKGVLNGIMAKCEETGAVGLETRGKNMPNAGCMAWNESHACGRCRRWLSVAGMSKLAGLKFPIQIHLCSPERDVIKTPQWA